MTLKDFGWAAIKANDMLNSLKVDDVLRLLEVYAVFEPVKEGNIQCQTLLNKN